jgi:murein endopeptidase
MLGARRLVVNAPHRLDREAVFAEARRRGHPDVLALVERLGEDAIVNPAGLLAWGSVDDPTLVRPPQPPLDVREAIE